MSSVTKGIIAAIAVLVLLWMYMALSSNTHTESPLMLEGQELNVWRGKMNNWNTVNLQEKVIPMAVKESLVGKVKVKTGKVNIMGVDVFYREAAPPEGSEPSGQTLLLLHGAAFTSKTWLDLGTISLMAALGHRVIAVDIPGFGNTAGHFSGSRAEFMSHLLTALTMAKPVILSPSMSGSYTIPFLDEHPDKFGGYVPVAPVRVDRISAEKLKSLEVPTLIIYGEKDTSLGHQARDHLKNIPTSRVYELPNAGHPAYLDQPVMFHQLLYNFFLRLRDQ